MTVERADTRFTSRCTQGQALTIPVKHGEGCWFAPSELVEELERNGQIVLRYAGDNPNGSVADVAGILNDRGNVLGLMPHPEHAVDPDVGPTGGQPLFASLLHVAMAGVTG